MPFSILINFKVEKFRYEGEADVSESDDEEEEDDKITNKIKQHVSATKSTAQPKSTFFLLA